MAPSSNTTPHITASSLRLPRLISRYLLVLILIPAGLYKLFAPIATLSHDMPWTGEHPLMVRFTGIVDIAGGIGLIIPSFIRSAALGVVALMVSAIVFHFSRGEQANTPFNFFLLALALFVWWGRTRPACTHFDQFKDKTSQR
eukprot:TRINITY_DN11859_c0_g1_i3.p1 TRINITY_DN11859_c0_g1~~TRINITY_DN11859_c0_g1_i3.p1  ORF type:complete len:151 (-),score=30.41 TRINITY_DN11859_c0_g1_i3:64-492(-)